MQFEGVDFSKVGVTQLVADQLATGNYRGREDGAPGDWLVRAWQALPEKEAEWVATAVNQALQNDSADIRAEAVRTLDICPQMADPASLLDLAETQFDLFRGLRRSTDGPQVDRGRDFVQLTASVADGERGRAFRRRTALDPVYGLHVLAVLVQKDADWVVAEADELFNVQIDPEGTRLTIAFFNLRQNSQLLAQLVKKLAQSQPPLHGRLQDTIRAKVRDEQQQRQLLALVK